ncbi:MAG: tRNA lysidine(34) synthetase TilS [Bacteroidales bacterium]
MKGKFLGFLHQNNLISGDKPVLLAVSGGLDSMVMTFLFNYCNINFSIAHCNFQLRGQESNDDEYFVRSVAKLLKVKLHVKKFNTSSIAVNKNQSIQIAARELRYSWFSEIAEKFNYQSIATAHHHDDSVESFFINLLRGTGIKGLSGIPVRNKNIIRPMLCFTRDEIAGFAELNKIPYRDDSSNDDLYYVRNQVRHLILPAIYTVQEQFPTVMKRNLNRIYEENILLQEYLSKIKQNLITQSTNDIRINIDGLLSSGHSGYLLLSVLENYGFNSQQVEDINCSLMKQSGKKFESENYTLYKDRKELILTEKRKEIKVPEEYFIELTGKKATLKNKNIPFILNFTIHKTTSELSLDQGKNIALLDLEKIQSTISVRKWRNGDAMYPLGMNGKKKISDILSDLKLSIPEKNEIFVVCSGKDILWITGIRINEKYKITKSTQKYLRISLLYT